MERPRIDRRVTRILACALIASGVLGVVVVYTHQPATQEQPARSRQSGVLLIEDGLLRTEAEGYMEPGGRFVWHGTAIRWGPFDWKTWRCRYRDGRLVSAVQYPGQPQQDIVDLSDMSRHEQVIINEKLECRPYSDGKPERIEFLHRQSVPLD